MLAQENPWSLIQLIFTVKPMLSFGRPCMALLAYTQWSFCPTRNRLRAHYEALLDAYREAWMPHLGLEGIEAASTLSRQQYRECDEPAVYGYGIANNTVAKITRCLKAFCLELRSELFDEPNHCHCQYEANAEHPWQTRFLPRFGRALQLGPEFRPILLI